MLHRLSVLAFPALSRLSCGTLYLPLPPCTYSPKHRLSILAPAVFVHTFSLPLPTAHPCWCIARTCALSNSCPLFATGPAIILSLHSERYTNAVEHPVKLPHSVEETDSK